jgi:hypothetical protein
MNAPEVSTQSVHTRALQKAAALVANEFVLAHLLGATRPRLHMWLAGIESVPTEVFLSAVDILNNESKISAALIERAYASQTPMQRAAALRRLLHG